LLKVGGVLTVLGLSGFAITMLWRERVNSKTIVRP